MDKKVYYCSGCKNIYIGAPGKTDFYCSKCGVLLYETDLYESEWNTFFLLQQKEFLKKCESQFKDLPRYTRSIDRSSHMDGIVIINPVKRKTDDNKIANILKTLVWLFWLIGLIVGINAGMGVKSVFNMFKYYGYDGPNSGFAFGTALIVWAIFFIIGIWLYAFAEILTLLEEIKTTSYSVDLSQLTLYSNDPLSLQSDRSQDVDTHKGNIRQMTDDLLTTKDGERNKSGNSFDTESEDSKEKDDIIVTKTEYKNEQLTEVAEIENIMSDDKLQDSKTASEESEQHQAEETKTEISVVAESMRPMFCPKCGRHIDDPETVFCAFCGAKVIE